MREEGFQQLYQGFATWLLQSGVPPDFMPFALLSLDLATLVLLVWLVRLITRGVLSVAHRLFQGSKSDFAQILVSKPVLNALTHLAPAIAFIVLVPYVFREFEQATPGLATVTYLYLALVLLRSALTFLDATRSYFLRLPAFAAGPVDIWVQIGKIIVWGIAIVVCLGIVFRKPPVLVLGGLGATSAVLLLVFRDTILGFVAGIQLHAMDMVRVGDWIQMDKYGANGDIIQVSLTTVKVRNFDRTVTTVPTYSLISDSVKNWRYMSDGDARRIKRPLLVDVTSIKACDDEMVRRFGAHEAALPGGGDPAPETGASSGTEDPEDGYETTNLGMFRRYVERYLRTSERISQVNTLMVRHLEPTRDGLPLEIYAFTNDARWTVYEKIQADLFEHLMAMAPKYDLVLFQAPAGRDLREAPIGAGGS